MKIESKVLTALEKLVESGEPFSIGKLCKVAQITRGSFRNHPKLLDLVRETSQASQESVIKRTDQQVIDSLNCVLEKIECSGDPFSIQSVLDLAQVSRTRLAKVSPELLKKIQTASCKSGFDRQHFQRSQTK